MTTREERQLELAREKLVDLEIKLMQNRKKFLKQFSRAILRQAYFLDVLKLIENAAQAKHKG